MQEFVDCLKKRFEFFHPRGRPFLLLEQHGARILVMADTVKRMPYEVSDELDLNTRLEVFREDIPRALSGKLRAD